MPLMSFCAHIGSRTLTAASWEVDNETALDKLIARLLGPLERTFELSAVTVLVDDTESPVSEGTSLSKEDLPKRMKADRLELAACMQQVRELKEQLGASELERALAESARDAIEIDVKKFQAAIVADQPVFLVGSTIWPTAWGTCLS